MYGNREMDRFMFDLSWDTLMGYIESSQLQSCRVAKPAPSTSKVLIWPTASTPGTHVLWNRDMHSQSTFEISTRVSKRVLGACWIAEAIRNA